MVSKLKYININSRICNLDFSLIFRLLFHCQHWFFVSLTHYQNPCESSSSEKKLSLPILSWLFLTNFSQKFVNILLSTVSRNNFPYSQIHIRFLDTLTYLSPPRAPPCHYRIDPLPDFRLFEGSAISQLSILVTVWLPLYVELFVPEALWAISILKALAEGGVAHISICPILAFHD